MGLTKVMLVACDVVKRGGGETPTCVAAVETISVQDVSCMRLMICIDQAQSHKV